MGMFPKLVSKKKRINKEKTDDIDDILQNKNKQLENDDTIGIIVVIVSDAVGLHQVMIER